MKIVKFDNSFKLYKSSKGIIFVKEEEGINYAYGSTKNKYEFQFETKFIIENKEIEFEMKKQVSIDLLPYSRQDKELVLKISLLENEPIIIHKINLEYNSIYKTALTYELHNFFYCSNGENIFIYRRNYNHINKEQEYYKIIFLNEDGEIQEFVNKNDKKTKNYLKLLLTNEFGIGFIKTEDPFERNDFEYSNSLMTSYNIKDIIETEVSIDLIEKVKEINEIKTEKILDLLKYLNLSKIKKVYLKNITILPPGGSDYSPIESSSLFLTDKVISNDIMNETKILFLK